MSAVAVLVYRERAKFRGKVIKACHKASWQKSIGMLLIVIKYIGPPTEGQKHTLAAVGTALMLEKINKYEIDGQAPNRCSMLSS